jgi:hypothetical protein
MCRAQVKKKPSHAVSIQFMSIQSIQSIQSHTCPYSPYSPQVHTVHMPIQSIHVHTATDIFLLPPPSSLLLATHKADALHLWPCTDFMLLAMPNQDKSYSTTMFATEETFTKVDSVCFAPLFILHTTLHPSHHPSSFTPLFILHTTLHSSHHSSSFTPLVILHTTLHPSHHSSSLTPLFILHTTLHPSHHSSSFTLFHFPHHSSSFTPLFILHTTLHPSHHSSSFTPYSSWRVQGQRVCARSSPKTSQVGQRLQASSVIVSN